MDIDHVRRKWNQDILAFADAVKYGHAFEVKQAIQPYTDNEAIGLIYHGLCVISDGSGYMQKIDDVNAQQRIMIVVEQLKNPTASDLIFPS